MKDKDLIREYHCFLLPDYEEEEAHLRQKHNEGYAFEKVEFPGFYYFRECEPEDVIYKLDFNPQKKDERDGYLQMYADYGWEYIQDMNDYSYFRKSAAAAEADGEAEIFNDNESKLDMMERIFKMKMLPILVVFLLIIIPQLSNFMEDAPATPAGMVLSLLTAVLIIFYVYVVVRCMAGFQKLRKKYNNKG